MATILSLVLDPIWEWVSLHVWERYGVVGGLAVSLSPFVILFGLAWLFITYG